MVADTSADRAAPDASGSDEDVRRMLKVAGGDRAAFEALYGRYGKPVMSFVYHLTWDRGLAEDLSQEVFLRVWRAAPGYRPWGKFSTWLFQIARNVAFTEGARLRKRRSRVASASDRPDDGGLGELGQALTGRPAEGDARRAELTAALREATGGLSDKLRVVFTLVRLEGRSYAETSEILEIPEGTVKSRMAAAEVELRERLRKFL